MMYWKLGLIALALLSVVAGDVTGQSNDRSSATDSSTNAEAVYARPFIEIPGTSTAIGGYVEGNTNYFQEDGISEGFSMELRRFNLFVYSAISKDVKFLSELEFEHGTEEISLETAQLDLIFDPGLVLRGGILLVPLGLFNQNHDSPKWDFIERPLVSTEIIPSTLSEVGIGFYGKQAWKRLLLSYEGYAVNGLRDGVLFNRTGRTDFQSGKDVEMFGEDNNGSPAFTGRLSFDVDRVVELGFSYYGGVYNTYQMDGAMVMPKRSLSTMALDFQTEVYGLRLFAEAARNTIELPPGTLESHGSAQVGMFVEANYTLDTVKIFRFDRVAISAGLRFDAIDYNQATFTSGANVGDAVTGLALSLALRPNASTVLRANYRYDWISDVLGNPRRSAGFQFGLASYF
jgi:hypothetical protein